MKLVEKKGENIEFARNVKDILDDKDIKLVTICTHVDSHYGYEYTSPRIRRRDT
ncbi:MAG TPA: hypothetical protein VIK26_05475 [Clostridium sp.]